MKPSAGPVGYTFEYVAAAEIDTPTAPNIPKALEAPEDAADTYLTAKAEDQTQELFLRD
jgi:hypothetical protein